MADIREAARWMRDGHEVKRAAWGGSPVRLHVCTRSGKVYDDLDTLASFSVVELIAEDWEIATIGKVLEK